MCNAKLLGERMKYVRRHYKMSQRELCNRLDMDDGSLRRIESGRTNPTLKTLHKVAQSLCVPLYVLFLPHEEFEEHFEKGARFDEKLQSSI